MCQSELKCFISNYSLYLVRYILHEQSSILLTQIWKNQCQNLDLYLCNFYLQTFHAPSFGDEDFELPPISIHSIPVSGAPLLQSINGYTSQQLAKSTPHRPNTV